MSAAVLFDSIAKSDVARVRAAIRTGRVAFCVTADAAAVAALGDRLVVLGKHALVEFDLADTRDFSLVELVERVYERLAPSTVVPAALEQLMQSSSAHFFFKRALFLEVASLLAIAVLADDPRLREAETIVLDARWPGGELFGSLLEALVAERGVLPEPLTHALEQLQVVSPSRLRRTAGAARHAARLLAVVSARLAGRRPAAGPVPLLLRTYGSDLGIDREGQVRLRNFDFVVGEGLGLSPEEIGVWAERDAGAERIDRSAARGYRVLGPGRTAVPLQAFLRSVLPAAFAFSLRALRSQADERWWLRRGSMAAATYLYVRHGASRIEPGVFVSTNELLPESVARNVALQQVGCTSVQYHHTCHWRAGPDGWLRDYVFAFAVVDVVATWGPAHARHILSHHGSIGRTWDVGCVWSEHARLVREDPAVRAYYEEVLEREHGMSLRGKPRVVGVFDTSVNILSAGDLDAFRNGVLDLAAALTDVVFVLKPKNPSDQPPAMPPNVVVLPNSFETAAVVGLSDITISACFTSTLIETVGSGRPGLYFDPTDRVPDAFWRRIPGLVCTSTDGLEARVRELLAADSHSIDAWLRTHFRELEGHFDGLGITRLRREISGELSGRRAVHDDPLIGSSKKGEAS